MMNKENQNLIGKMRENLDQIGWVVENDKYIK
jgi:hypothetical protein